MDKICGICGEDCSDRPRVKDRKGRYFCKSCAMEHAARGGPAEAAPPQPGAALDESPYDLDDAEPGASPLPIEMLDHVEQTTPCPVCMHSMAPGAKVCIACGYHVEKGIQTSTQIERRKTGRTRRYSCRECGYDLTGLRDAVCPECGTRARLAKSDLREQVERDVLAQEWRKPLIWFAVGIAGMSASYVIAGAPEVIPIYGIVLAAEILVGFAVLWVCFNFIGDVGTPLLNLVRLAGIYALVDLVGLLAGLLPIPIIPWLITVGTYVGLFSDTFETDWQDSILVIFLTVIVKFTLVLVLAFYLPDLLGAL